MIKDCSTISSTRRRHSKHSTSPNAESITHHPELHSATSITHHSRSPSTTSMSHHTGSLAAAQEDKEERYHTEFNRLVAIFPDLILRDLDTEDISNLRMVLPPHTSVAGHAIRNNHDYKDAFGVFFEHSPRALEALSRDNLSCLLEIVALKLHLKKLGTIPSFAFNRFPTSSSHLVDSSKKGDIVDIFWHFLCLHRHPIVICVPDDADSISHIKMLPDIFKHYRARCQVHHVPRIVFKVKSKTTCLNVQHVLNTDGWQRQHHHADGTDSLHLAGFVVEEEVDYAACRSPHAFWWNAKDNRQFFHDWTPLKLRLPLQDLRCYVHDFRARESELIDSLAMLSVLRLSFGAIETDLKYGFPHLRTLECDTVKFDVALLPHQESLTILELWDCAISLGAPIKDKFPNLQQLIFDGTDGPILPIETYRNLLDSKTLRYLRLTKHTELDIDQLTLPHNLATFITDTKLLKTVQILETAPNLHTLEVISSSYNLRLPWPSSAFDLTSFLSISDVVLGQQPSPKLTLPSTIKLTLKDFSLSKSIHFAGISSLTCIVLSELYDVSMGALDALMDSFSAVKDLSIIGLEPHTEQYFSRLPASLTRFSVRKMLLQTPTAILKATLLVRLQIVDCTVGNNFIADLKLGGLDQLQSLTVERTPGSKGLIIPANVHYHHDHDH